MVNTRHRRCYRPDRDRAATKALHFAQFYRMFCGVVTPVPPSRRHSRLRQTVSCDYSGPVDRRVEQDYGEPSKQQDQEEAKVRIPGPYADPGRPQDHQQAASRPRQAIVTCPVLPGQNLSFQQGLDLTETALGQQRLG
jgi:hypothetical protein